MMYFNNDQLCTMGMGGRGSRGFVSQAQMPAKNGCAVETETLVIISMVRVPEVVQTALLMSDDKICANYLCYFRRISILKKNISCVNLLNKIDHKPRSS